MPKKDYFAQLSPSQKAELFSIYARAGYKTLSSIKEHYNKYAKGGEIGDPPNSTTHAPGAATLEKYAGTNYDPMYFWDNIAHTEEGARNYLTKRNIRESAGAQDVVDYFKSYATSPGVNRIINNQQTWWHNRHPYQRLVPFQEASMLAPAKQFKKFLPTISKDGVFDLDTYIDLSNNIIQGDHRVIKVGTLDNKENPYNLVLPHEMIHSFNLWGEGVRGSGIGGAQSEALNMNTNTEPGHDSMVDEKHSDLEGLRYLLFKEGIYDSRDNKDATPEDIEKLRKKYPKIRPLLQMDNERAAWMINHVVDASERQNMSNIIADGGPKKNLFIKKKEDFLENSHEYLDYFDADEYLNSNSSNFRSRLGKYDISSVGNYGDTHFSVISSRYNGIKNAMKRNGFTDEETSRLLPFLISQNILEGGYKLSRDDNNFGGILIPGTKNKMQFKTEDDFYNYYLHNLDEKWGDDYLGKGKGWRNARTLQEYADIINREDLGLHTKEAYEEYNRQHKDHPAYLYTPLWENNDTGLMDNAKLGGIYPRVYGMLDILYTRMHQWEKFARENKIYKNRKKNLDF